MAVQSSVGRMRLVRSVGSPPRYMSPSRSRISLSPLAVNGVLLLLTEMVPEPWKGDGGRDQPEVFTYSSSSEHHKVLILASPILFPDYLD